MLIAVFNDNKTIESIASLYAITYDSPDWVSIELETNDVIAIKGAEVMEELGFDLTEETMEFETNRYDAEFELDGHTFHLFMYYNEAGNELIAVDSVAVDLENNLYIDFNETEFYDFVFEK